MMLCRKDGVPFFQFSHMAACPGVHHAIFTRHGGVSPAPYDSLNAGFGIGDAKAHVAANREIIAGVFAPDDLVTLRQVHGDQVVVLDHTAMPDGRRHPAAHGDALASDQKGKALMIQVADCQPVLLYDPVRKVAANIHSGWRGSVQNIIGRTVRTLTRRFNARPGDILAGIGPSLGPCCAEFVNFAAEIPRPLWHYKDGGHRFDFWALSVDQLRQEGVAAENIQVSRMCSRCNPGLFFSYRGEKVTGRLAAVISLR